MPRASEGCIHVVIEIPRGSRNKYEIDHDTGHVFLDRRLFTATTYPADYGFIPDTLGGDGDPLDALVLLEDPTFPGVWVEAKPVGVLWMQDEAGADAKIICVPPQRPPLEGRRGPARPARGAAREIKHFFDVYKALEPGKASTRPASRTGKGAWREIERSRPATSSPGVGRPVMADLCWRSPFRSALVPGSSAAPTAPARCRAGDLQPRVGPEPGA